MDYLTKAWADQAEGISEGTRTQQLGNTNRWEVFLHRCQIYDRFLNNFGINERIAILSAFASALRRNALGPTRKTQLSGKTVSAAIAHVCASFRTNLRRDPSLEEGGEKSMLLKRQLKGYKFLDPPTNHKKCLPLKVFQQLQKDHRSELTKKHRSTDNSSSILRQFFGG